MWTYILITLTTVCCLIYLVLISRSRVVLPPAIPGALPIIGHAHLLLGDGKALWKTVKDFEDYCVKQGGVVHIKLGPKIFYLIADPDDYQNVLSNCLEKNYIYSLILGEWVGKGLVTAPVAVWKNLSKLLSPAFNQQVLYEYVDIHNSQAKALVSRLAQFCGKPFNPIAHHIKRAAFEVNILTAFGLELTDKISHSINQYMKAIDVITNVLSKRVQKVWLHHPALYKWSALKKQQDATMKIINDFSDSIMKQKREASNNKTKTGIVKSGKFKGFMDLAMELSAGGILTDLEILEQVNSTVFAGYETTSETLNLVLVVLGSYPHVQSRVYKELQEVLKGPNRDVRKEDLSKLFYLEAVIKEVCRLYCVAPVLLRYVDKDIKLKNYTLKAGSDCVVMVRAINRAEVWGPDREEFRPERWLEDSLPDNSNVYTGFGAGRRACLGRQFSLTLMKIFLAHLLRHYKVSADHTKLDMKLEITLKPVAGHYISIDPRH